MYPKGRKPKISKDGRIEERAILNVLKLKVGARCVLTSNLDTSDDLVNGACGTIRALEIKDDVIQCIVVEFDSESCGEQHRAKYPGLSKKYVSKNGTPIFQQEVEIQLQSKSGKGLGIGSTAKIRQFPIMIYYASTAHKIQVCTELALQFIGKSIIIDPYFLYCREQQFLIRQR